MMYKFKSIVSACAITLLLAAPSWVLAEEVPVAAPAVTEAAVPEAPALAAEAPAVAAPVLNSGDTAWMLTSTALVLLMTIPGLALFYAGMVRSKNVLSVLMQCFAVTSLVTVLWALYVYSLVFDVSGMEKGVVNFNSFFGGLSKAFLSGVTVESVWVSIPETVFMTFQMTFAIITPALIVGAFAERMKFSAMLWFTGLWLTFVYAPIAHMVWSGDGGLMWDWGVLDFAGGTVVHINAGIAGLVAALVLGKRAGYGTVAMAPHNPQGPVSTAASLEFGFATPSYIICESVHADVPWREAVVGEGFTVEKKGRIVRPNTRPGLGIEIDETEVARHPFEQEVLHRSFHKDGSVADW